VRLVFIQESHYICVGIYIYIYIYIQFKKLTIVSQDITTFEAALIPSIRTLDNIIIRASVEKYLRAKWSQQIGALRIRPYLYNIPIFSGTASHLGLPGPEDECITDLQNICNYLPAHTA